MANENYESRLKLHHKESGEIEVLKIRDTNKTEQEICLDETFSIKEIKERYKFQLQLFQKELLTTKKVIFNTQSFCCIHTILENTDRDGALTIFKKVDDNHCDC